MIDAIGLDADDTLWENEGFFREAETRLAKQLADYCDVDTVARHLLQVERQNLSLYGFGIKPFSLSMIQAAIELTDSRISGAEISRVLQIGREMLTHPVELLNGVPEALEALSGKRLILITKGDLLDQRRKVEESGLADRFEGIEIVADKTPVSYRDVLSHYGIAPERFLMAGNSVKSDILPVLELGAYAALIPHELTWHVEHAEEPTSPKYHRLTGISELPGLIDRIGNSG